MLTSKHGFTIVELLVVIVVIAILAAVTIVSYNGIQKQAKNTQFLSAFDVYDKALRNIRTIDGSFPTSLHEGVSSTCMGSVQSYPQTSNLAEGVCYKAVNNGTEAIIATVNPTLNQRLLADISALPRIVFDEYSFSFGGSTYWVRGIFYTAHGADPQLTYILADPSLPCGRGQKSLDPTGFTICVQQSWN